MIVFILALVVAFASGDGYRPALALAPPFAEAQELGASVRADRAREPLYLPAHSGLAEGQGVEPEYSPSLPILLTWYDPARGGINCDSDCSTFADGSAVTAGSYGQVAACIPAWLGATISLPGVGVFQCRDTGPAVAVAWNEYYGTWVIHVDVLAAGEPEWNYWLVEEWWLEWP